MPNNQAQEQLQQKQQTSHLNLWTVVFRGLHKQTHESWGPRHLDFPQPAGCTSKRQKYTFRLGQIYLRVCAWYVLGLQLCWPGLPTSRGSRSRSLKLWVSLVHHKTIWPRSCYADDFSRGLEESMLHPLPHVCALATFDCDALLKSICHLST